MRHSQKFWKRPVAVVAAMAMVVTTAFIAGPGLAPAGADPAPAAAAVSQTTGGGTLAGTIPPGVCRVIARGVGAGGGSNYATSSDPNNPVPGVHVAGYGADATISVPVAAGQSYAGTVGGGGGGVNQARNVGGINGGGAGGQGPTGTFHSGAGGGGYTQLSIAGVEALVMGGGGGSGGGHHNEMQGGDAGVPAGIGTAAAGQDGKQGRDGNTFPFLPPGAGGGTAAPGTFGTNPLDASLNGQPGAGRTGGDAGPNAPNSIDGAGGGGGGYFGGGGGAGTTVNGSGGTRAVTDNLSVGGSGGGGGSSFISGTAVDGLGSVPTLVSSALASAGGPGDRGEGATSDGADGLIDLQWVMCDYNLDIEKSVTPTSALVGDTVTWTVSVTNTGPDPMTQGDTVTITDSLPGAGPKTITSIVHTPGANSGLDQGAMTCNASVASPMSSPIDCSQPYSASGAAEAPSGGVRGLDVGGNITITYTQVIAAADVTTPPSNLVNTARVTDRNGGDSSVAEVEPAREETRLDIAKTAGTPVNNGDGTYNVTYEIEVANPASVPNCLNDGSDACFLTDNTNVQVSDGLATVFGAGAIVSASNAVLSGPCSGSSIYDGITNTDLLVGLDTLAPGETCVISITVKVTVDTDDAAPASLGETTNTATATSDEIPDGVTDGSTVTLAENPSMTVDKAVSGGPTNNGDGTYDLQYTIDLVNTGDVELENVQISDGLDAVFGAALVSGSQTTNDPCTADAAYTGVTPNTNLLVGTDTVPVGGSCQVIVTVTVTVDSTNPDSAAIDTDYTNSASGSGSGPGGTPAGDSGSATTQFTEDPSIDVIKTVLDPPGAVNNLDGTYTVSYEIQVINDGNVELRNVQTTDGLEAVFGAGLVGATASVTAGTCTANAGYTGAGANTDLLAGTDTIPIGGACTILITATVTVDDAVAGAASVNTDYTNTADGSGSSPSGESVSDADTGTTQLPENPSIDIIKTLSAGPTNNGDGTYDLEYTIDVINDGDVPLDSVQVADGLDAVFGAALVSGTATTGTPCTENAGYTGVAPNTDLLVGTDVIPVGGSCQIIVSATVTVDSTNPDAAAVDTTFTNTADGSGTAPSGQGVSDSDDESTLLKETPSMDVIKTVTDGPTNNQDGTYSLEYTIDVINDGDVDLLNVQVTDGLDAVFGNALVTGAQATEAPCIANGSYTGIAPNTDLLTGTDTIPVGASCQIVIQVTVTVDSTNPDAAAVDTDYTNTAAGSGTSPAGEGVGDSDIDTTQFTETPSIDVVKTLTDGPTNNGDGTYDLEYTIDVINDGDVDLLNVQVTDGLDAVFPGAIVSAVQTTGTPCTADPAYTGVAPGVNLLVGTDTVAVGESCQIVVSITVTVDSTSASPAALDTTLTNTANGSGTSPGGEGVSDSDDDSTILEESPSIDVIKTITAGPTNNQDGTWDIQYTIDAINDGDVDLLNVQVTDGLEAVFGAALQSATATTLAPCTVDAGYTGLAPATNLLVGSDTIPVNGSCSIVIDVVVLVDGSADAAALATNFANTADGSGTSPGGEGVADSDTADAEFNENPSLGIDKTITAGPTNNQDGTYDLEYTLDIVNDGDVEMHDVQVWDGLDVVFGPALVAATQTSTAPCTSSTTYDGVTDALLLVGTDTLPVLGTCQIVITVTVSVQDSNPDSVGIDTDYNNMASVSGTSPGGNAAGDTDDATTTFGENPSMEVLKSVVGPPVNNGDGTHTVDYLITMENTGDVDLLNVQLTDGLEAVFGTALVSASTSTVLPCSTNASYTGTAAGDINLLSGTDTLPVGAICGVNVEVVVTAGDLGPHSNTAAGSGTSPSGEGVADDDPADVTLVENPAIDIVKAVSMEPTSNNDGTFDMQWEMVITNTGDIVLNNVQVQDPLAFTYATAVSWIVTGTGLNALDTCTVNPAFDGLVDVELLMGTDSLTIGSTCTITVDVTFEPGANLGEYTNAASVEATSPGGEGVSGEADADVTVVENPVIDIVKTVLAPPVNDGTGIFTMAYQITTTNTGDVPLSGVQVTDDLAAAFATVASWSATSSVSAGLCTANAAFDGAADMNLLAGTDGLAVLESCTTDIVVTFDPNGALGDYVNAAGTSGTSPGGEGVDDMDSTDEAVEENPAIDVVKDIIDPPGIVNNSDGTYDITYGITTTNVGDVPLNNVQLTDDLTATFAAAIGFDVDPGVVIVTAGPCSANSTFDGSADQGLLAGTDSLVVGQSCSVEFVVTVTPGTTLGTYTNDVLAEGTSPGGQGVNDADDVDNEYPENPEISLAKDIIEPPAVVNNQDGTYSLTYRLVASNTGDVPLNNAQVTDDMALTFATATSWSVVRTTIAIGDPCSANAAYTGDTDINLLTGTDTMAVGDICTIDIEVLVTPGSDLGPYNNSAEASGTSPGGEGVSDVSQDGSDPDPDASGSGGDNSDPTPAWFTEEPQISLNKTIIGAASSNQDGTYNVTYRLDVANSGNVILFNVQVDDDMAATLAMAVSWAVTDVRVSAGACNASTTYDGGLEIGTLAGTDSMAVADTCSIEIDVTFEPGAFLGSYDNTATASGTSPAGEGVEDIGQDGDDADPDGDNDPSNNSDPTPLTVEENPEISLSKDIITDTVNNGDGSYSFTYGLVATNTGDITLFNTQVVDDLAATFTGATSWSMDGLAVTAGACTASGSYDGAADTGLLAGTDTMAVGDACTIEIAVTVIPGADPGPYNNTATASGTSPAGEGVEDISQDGNNPDTDMDGDPTNNNDPTPVSFDENPELSLTKDITAGPISNLDGSFDLQYSMVVTNTGDVQLNGVQVDDDLGLTFQSATGWTLGSVAVTAGDCTASATYDGIADIGALDGTDTMQIGDSCTIEIDLVVTPGAVFGPYDNTAGASGTSPAGTGVADEANEAVSFDENPEIGLAKDITAGPTSNQDGTFDLQYTLVVQNTGDVSLSGVQVDDDLAATFAGATGFTVTAVAVTDGTCDASTTFDGSTDIGTLAGTDTLSVGEDCTIVIDLVVTPGADFGPHDNSATASGTSPGGAEVDDISQDGADVDADGDGDPNDDSDPTPVSFGEDPKIALAKDITAGPTSNFDGTFDLQYTLVAQNTGNVNLSGAQVDDDLEATFAGATGFLVTAVSVTDGACTASSTYDGSADTGTLAGTDTMQVNDSCTIVIDLVVTPGSDFGPYDNTATASGVSPAGTDVTDVSQDGADVDADGNGDPGNDSDPTRVSFGEDPKIALAKDITAGPTSNSDGTYDLQYTLLVQNVGDVSLSGVQVDDDLELTYAGAAGWSFTSVAVTAGDCTASSTYDGSADIGTLAGTDTMQVNDSCTIVIDVVITPGADLGPYNNTALALGTSPGGTEVTDRSQDGADPDPDLLGAGANNLETPAWFTEDPQISLSKDITAGPVNNNDGTWSLTYGLVVANSGNVSLADVQVDDDLGATFGSTVFAVTDVRVDSGACTASTTYDGSADIGTLAGTDTMAVADTCVVSIDVDVTPAGVPGPYDNTATANGTSPAGEDVTDISQDGTDADPDGDNDPLNNSDPTPVEFPTNPLIALSKRVIEGPELISGSTYAVSYGLVVVNSGDVLLNNVQVDDSLQTTYATAEAWELTGTSILAGACTTGSGYNGDSNTGLLSGSDSLVPGESCTIGIDVEVTVGLTGGEYDNSATASGTSPGGQGVTDTSQDGVDRDPDGDGDASNNSVPTRVLMAGVAAPTATPTATPAPTPTATAAPAPAPRPVPVIVPMPAPRPAPVSTPAPRLLAFTGADSLRLAALGGALLAAGVIIAVGARRRSEDE